MSVLVQMWMGHDGYRDPDDNLSMLLGAAYARTVARSDPDVRIAGLVYGDTKDGGQYYMLHPEGSAPKSFGSDSRYGDVAGNRQAAGNYAFFKDYGAAAVKALGIGPVYDLLSTDGGGHHAWNFDAHAKSDLSSAGAALADDIADAIGRDTRSGEITRLVVYSAGGGGNVAGEAVGYLKNLGYGDRDIVNHFAVVQHGNNWVTNYEPEARALTRDLTIALSNQNYARYANGMSGPDLKHALPGGSFPDGSKFGAAFAEALAVATGARDYAGLPGGVIFKTTRDASDAGSHAFAVDHDRLLAALDARLDDGEMQTGDDWAYRVDLGGSSRLRVIYDKFDAQAIARLLGGGSGGDWAGIRARIRAGGPGADPAADPAAATRRATARTRASIPARPCRCGSTPRSRPAPTTSRPSAAATATTSRWARRRPPPGPAIRPSACASRGSTSRRTSRSPAPTSSSRPTRPAPTAARSPSSWRPATRAGHSTPPGAWRTGTISTRP